MKPTLYAASTLFLALAAATGALAQTKAPAAATRPAASAAAAAPGATLPAVGQAAPPLAGKTLDGKPFALSTLKGKVVLVMFWSTECAVCRDKMGELRQNYAGWAGRPFEMVLVSVDRRMQDLADYEQIISRTVPLKQRFVQLWSGEAEYKDGFGRPAQLPASFLIDKNGKVIDRWQGRIPVEAWDKIADLL